MQQALKLAELEFRDEQLTMMLADINRNLRTYEALRKIAVPLDTEPAFRFQPKPPSGLKISLDRAQRAPNALCARRRASTCFARAR